MTTPTLNQTTVPEPVVLITGAARRIGADIAQYLHQVGYRLVLHYRHSSTEANALTQQLNRLRPDSAVSLQADLKAIASVQALAAQALQIWGRVDVLINNASAFYPTPIGQVSESHWDDLMSSNLKAPFFLAQALAEELKKNQGCIINIADIYGERPLPDHAVYCAAKAGNIMLTKALARDLAPQVRVNGIAPGAILWPEQIAEHTHVLDKIPLQKRGSPQDIAKSVLFLIRDAAYTTGEILVIDGGRSIFQ